MVPVFPTKEALLPEDTQNWLLTPVSTHVSPLSPVVVSAPPVGAGSVPAKEFEPVKTAPAKGLLCRGFLGSRNVSSSSLPGMKEASLSVKGSKVVVEDSLTCSISGKHAAELGLRLSEPFPRMSESGAPIYSSVSKSQIGYARRVKEKLAKQLQKNKELFADVVAEPAEKGAGNYSEVVIDAVNFASSVGLSNGEGGDEKSLLNLFSNIEEEREPSTSKAKGKREIKNLECSINYEVRERLSPKRYYRRRGCVGTKNAFSFPPEVH
ncbi:uncharacterized protein LOC132164496 [Corylus avellana]|uniref:uncharacterized protein LOC132164496 n=1 Tax=Corylus avellana TaxID=13451 RepID=UPI00286A7200|nr:uncharacterized protein LOC132164496 [Corylus avellana]